VFVFVCGKWDEKIVTFSGDKLDIQDGNPGRGGDWIIVDRHTKLGMQTTSLGPI